MMMNREDEMFSRRLADLSRACMSQNRVLFSDFLDLNQQHIFHSVRRDLSAAKILAFGGYEGSERQMLAFLPDALYFGESCAMEDIFPIMALLVRPVNARFAGRLSHRDYLGALMNLGIDRSKTGDIAVQGQEAVVFAADSIAGYLCDHLQDVGRTRVTCESVSLRGFSYRPAVTTVRGTVASVRPDALISLVFDVPRSQVKGMLEGGRVFVDGRLAGGNGVHLQPGSLISVRGLGRFRYLGENGNSKKGRIIVEAEKYI